MRTLTINYQDPPPPPRAYHVLLLPNGTAALVLEFVACMANGAPSIPPSAIRALLEPTGSRLGSLAKLTRAVPAPGTLITRLLEWIALQIASPAKPESTVVSVRGFAAPWAFGAPRGLRVVPLAVLEPLAIRKGPPLILPA